MSRDLAPSFQQQQRPRDRLLQETCLCRAPRQIQAVLRSPSGRDLEQAWERITLCHRQRETAAHAGQKGAGDERRTFFSLAAGRCLARCRAPRDALPCPAAAVNETCAITKLACYTVAHCQHCMSGLQCSVNRSLPTHTHPLTSSLARGTPSNYRPQSALRCGAPRGRPLPFERARAYPQPQPQPQPQREPQPQQEPREAPQQEQEQEPKQHARPRAPREPQPRPPQQP